VKTGPSVSSAAMGKMNLTVKAISEGGFESLYKQIFTTYPNEKLKKTFACYLSTTTGPVAGTLYLSNIHIAFCSDRPLSFTAPSGQETWSYYKVMVPLGKIGTVNPVIMRENQSEKYIQIVTVDGHDFWFMGFVNYDKAVKNLSEGVSHFVVPGVAVPSSN
ncbi:gem-like protein 5-like, partial [Trifolium pratense]